MCVPPAARLAEAASPAGPLSHYTIDDVLYEDLTRLARD